MNKWTCLDCGHLMPYQAVRWSEERRGHECRSNLQCLNRLSRRFRVLKSIGAQMANACFNLSQSQQLSDHNREVLRQLQTEWDTAMREGAR